MPRHVRAQSPDFFFGRLDRRKTNETNERLQVVKRKIVIGTIEQGKKVARLREQKLLGNETIDCVFCQFQRFVGIFAGIV